MMWAGIIATVVSTAVSAYSAYQQGQQQSAVARYNKKTAENQAIAQRQAAEAAAQDKQEQARRMLASQRVRAGASGIVQTEGSPLLAELDSTTQAALDVARIRYGGEQAARASQSEAKLQGYYGRIARQRATVGVASSVLSGVSRGASMYRGGGGGGGFTYSPEDI